MVDDYFRMLEDWKRLPSYKLETRIDSLVGFVLPKVMENLYGIKTKVLIPELPIRLATVHPEHEGTSFANRSYKVDFYIRSQLGKNFFIEFKSDSGSRREKQDEYLHRSIDVRMKSILEGILIIAGVSSYRDKYAHLLEKFRLAGLVDRSNSVTIGDEPIGVMYVQPTRRKEDKPEEVLDFGSLAEEIRNSFEANEFMTRFSSSLEKWAND